MQILVGNSWPHAINKHIYLSTLPMAGLASSRYRFLHSKIETVGDVRGIEHPVINAVLGEEEFSGTPNLWFSCFDDL